MRKTPSTLFARALAPLFVAVLFLCACQEKPQATGTGAEMNELTPELPTLPESPAAPAEQETPAEPEATAPAPEASGSAAAPVPPAPAPEDASPAPADTAALVSSTNEEKMKTEEAPASPSTEVITLGGGCFWCTEAVMQRLEGVLEVVSGYMGGHVENPTYEQICTKTTGHAEVIQVTFDPGRITLDEVLDVFWQAHDPTTLNRQGADVGPQYRSVIFYHTPEQRNIAMQSMKSLDESGVYADPAVTEISEASTFWVAEDYHQNYYALNKDKNPYCRVVISPKLKKLGLDQ